MKKKSKPQDTSKKTQPQADLKEYIRKRNFAKTPEPEGKSAPPSTRLRFVIQKHAASHLHYDLRLEIEGDFKSWAVPKGPSLNPTEQRLAVRVENHPIDYGSFEGIIPEKNYGAGTVMIWDAGWLYSRKTRDYEKGHTELVNGLKRGHLTFILEGQKLRGEFALVKLKDSNEKSWLLIKKGDTYSQYKGDVLALDRSVATGRTMEEITKQAKLKGEIWLPGKDTQTAALQSPYHSVESQPETKVTPKLPRRIKVMLPVQSKKSFVDANWIFEPVLDGTRAIAELDGKATHFYSRAGVSLTSRASKLALELKSYPTPAVLDGQLVADKKGNFCYLIWDVLFWNGIDYRNRPLIERKKVLAELPQHTKIEVNPWLEGKIPKTKASKILARHAQSLYRGGVDENWHIFDAKATKADAPHVTVQAGKKTKLAVTQSTKQTFTHLNKIFWPATGHTKGDVIEYYRRVASVLLPYLKDRPMSLHRHPNGVTKQSFFQKDVTGYLPSFVETTLVQHSDKSVNYFVCQNEDSLLYLANLGCIELNPWLSRKQNLDVPDWGVIDLDPVDVGFEVVVEVAQVVHQVLQTLKLESFCKTSGSKGIHILLPNTEHLNYERLREAILNICNDVHKRIPQWTSLERSPAKRRRRVYLDYLQNARGQTLAAPYCLRPKSNPLVSAPLRWAEVNANLKLEDFTIESMPTRLAKLGDLWAPLLNFL